jgi:hypothetical protein
MKKITVKSSLRVGVRVTVRVSVKGWSHEVIRGNTILTNLRPRIRGYSYYSRLLSVLIFWSFREIGP